jgi:hypothetical protein
MRFAHLPLGSSLGFDDQRLNKVIQEEKCLEDVMSQKEGQL